MLSLIAKSLFWLARYIERAEDTARIFDVNYHMLLLEQAQDSYRLRWEPLIIMAGKEKLFRELYGEVNAENVFEFLAFRQDNPSSILQCISRARKNARTIRDRISREMSEDINGSGQSLSVDVRVRPALDDSGIEHLNKITSGKPPPTSVLKLAQQPGQQQQ